MESIGNLRKFRNIASHKSLKTEPEQTTLLDVILPVVELLSPVADKSRVRIEVQYSEASSFVVDKRLLHEALVNVVSNAIEASNEGGRVLIRGSIEDGKEVVILVRDQGRGLSKADASRIFEGSFSTKPKGRGFGLYITKTILETLGGSIRLLASGFAKGTTMAITLPIEPRPSRAQGSA